MPKPRLGRRIAAVARSFQPSRQEIVRSCRLALAFERLLAEENAVGIGIDCYGTMWNKTILLPAYPCLGFSRLNNLGLSGIGESDMHSAMMFLIYKGLAGRPGFISDPTVDESAGAMILAHCLGTPGMDGPGKPPAPFKLRCVMERQEGVCPQVFRRVGQAVTQAQMPTVEQLIYFTGQVIEAPDIERGCRTKIAVKVDGDIERLWRNWRYGLHRVTCYGHLAKDLAVLPVDENRVGERGRVTPSGRNGAPLPPGEGLKYCRVGLDRGASGAHPGPG